MSLGIVDFLCDRARMWNESDDVVHPCLAQVSDMNFPM